MRGDLVVFDNLLLAHGRRPYRGERAVRVAHGSYGWMTSAGDSSCS
jgi:hypothetical protein